MKIKALISISYDGDEPEADATGAASDRAPRPSTQIVPTDGQCGLPFEIRSTELNLEDVVIQVETPLGGGGAAKPFKLSNNANAPERQVVVEESTKLTMLVKAGLEAERTILLDTSERYSEKLAMFWRGLGSKIQVTEISLYFAPEAYKRATFKLTSNLLPLLFTHLIDCENSCCEDANLGPCRIIKFNSALTLNATCPVDMLLTIMFDSGQEAQNERVLPYIMRLRYQMLEDATTGDFILNEEGEAYKSKVKFNRAKINDLKLLLDLPTSPRPFTIDKLTYPPTTTLGKVLPFDLLILNNTDSICELFYNLILPAEENPSAELDWQIVGFTCNSVTFEPRGSVTIRFGLIPLVSGVLKLPTLQLSPKTPGNCRLNSSCFIGCEVQESCWTSVRIRVEPQLATKCKLRLVGQVEDSSESERNAV